MISSIRVRLFGVLALLAVGWLFIPLAAATLTPQGPKLVGTGSEGSILEGSAVAVSADGNTVIVGGPGDNAGVGAAWVYTRRGGAWTQEAKLTSADALRAAQGSAVAVSADGNTAVVGGPHDNGDVGAAWVYTRSAGVWTQQAQLVGSDSINSALQGQSVAVSGDGNTVVVGGGHDAFGVGAAWVYTRSAGVWTQNSPKLIGSGAVPIVISDIAVAVSADGSTVILGRGGAGDFGAAWVFSRSSGVWAQQGDKLVGTGGEGYSRQGSSVAISADGNTAAIGGPGDAPGIVGATWVFTRNAGVWSQQGPKLVGSDATGLSARGASVALSADGNTLLVGGPMTDCFDLNGHCTGAAWVFARSNGSWSQQDGKWVGADAIGWARQGTAVALSADGNTAIIGGPQDAESTGAAWVYTRNNGVWAQQGGKLVGSGAVGQARQGVATALSADGSTAIIGGSNDAGGVGAAWVYTRSNGVWTQQGAKLVGSGAVGKARQGEAVALSADGNTAIVGGPDDAGGEGAAWIYVRRGGAWTQQGSKLAGSDTAPRAYGYDVVRSRQGSAVALAADGNTAVVGGPGDNLYAGAAWIFVRSGEKWTQQGAKMAVAVTESSPGRLDHEPDNYTYQA